METVVNKTPEVKSIETIFYIFFQHESALTQTLMYVN